MTGEKDAEAKALQEGKALGHREAEIDTIKARIKRLEALVALVGASIAASWAKLKGLY